MNIPLSARLNIPDGVMMREVAGEAVILNLNTEVYFGLDPVGTRMWTLLQESRSIETTRDRLLEEYDIDSQTLTADLLTLVEQLLDHDLVELVQA